MCNCACYVTGEGHQLLIDFKAYKEKLLCEELVIADSNNPAETLTLVFHARVLGMSFYFFKHICPRMFSIYY